MNTVKSNFSKLPNSIPTNYPLKAYSSLNTDVKTHRDFIKKIAEPFICYKHLQSEQQEIIIAGYKTSGVHPNKSAFSTHDYSITKEAIEKVFVFYISSIFSHFVLKLDATCPPRNKLNSFTVCS